ncbi:hypothetical protein ABW19_dt0206551 [Dactylella cylindrospora]|nr:hypothetical protein ABW19_dt0206551 [Dactylella cylindrospora]
MSSKNANSEASKQTPKTHCELPTLPKSSDGLTAEEVFSKITRNFVADVDDSFAMPLDLTSLLSTGHSNISGSSFVLEDWMDSLGETEGDFDISSDSLLSLWFKQSAGEGQAGVPDELKTEELAQAIEKTDKPDNSDYPSTPHIGHKLSNLTHTSPSKSGGESMLAPASSLTTPATPAFLVFTPSQFASENQVAANPFSTTPILNPIVLPKSTSPIIPADAADWNPVGAPGVMMFKGKPRTVTSYKCYVDGCDKTYILKKQFWKHMIKVHDAIIESENASVGVDALVSGSNTVEEDGADTVGQAATEGMGEEEPKPQKRKRGRPSKASQD